MGKKGRKRERKGRDGQTHLSGGKGESVRMSREGVIRDMTHHTGAAHWRANTLEPTETNLAAYVLHICCMLNHACVILLKRISVCMRYLEQKTRSGGWDRGGGPHAAKDKSLIYIHVSLLSRHGAMCAYIFLPDLFYLWWSGTANCCWTRTEASLCLAPLPLLSLSLALQTRERASKKAWR